LRPGLIYQEKNKAWIEAEAKEQGVTPVHRTALRGWFGVIGSLLKD